ncbi:MAG: hypothetical protein U0441_11745 [Polyangiaceae bacterium]
MPRRPSSGSLILAASLLSGLASAADPTPIPQPSAAPSATASATTTATIATDPAQALFDAGLADMEAGRFEKACPAIEASHRMDPRPGTLFTLAECEAQRGRAATAMRYYAEYLGLYKNLTPAKKNEQRERAKTSEEQLRKLALLAPKLTIVVVSGGGPDVIVKRDGEVVADLSLGTALPVDPGDHVITAQAPDGPESSVRVAIAPGESKTAELYVRHTAPVVTATFSAIVAPVKPPKPVDSQRPWRIGTFTSGALGLVGIATGIVTGIVATQLRTEAAKECHLQGGEQKCSEKGLALVDQLRPYATASTIAFAAGGLGLAVGLTLFIATPRVPTATPPVGPPRTTMLPYGEIGVHVGGKF